MFISLNISGCHKWNIFLYSSNPYANFGEIAPRISISSPQYIAVSRSAAAKASLPSLNQSSYFAGNLNHNWSGTSAPVCRNSTRAENETSSRSTCISGSWMIIPKLYSPTGPEISREPARYPQPTPLPVPRLCPFRLPASQILPAAPPHPGWGWPRPASLLPCSLLGAR